VLGELTGAGAAAGNTRRQPRRLIGLLAILTIVFGAVMGALAGGGQAWAHAVLLQSSPAADAELDSSPESIVLTFNERLEDGLYYIRVLDRDKRQMTDNKPVMSDDRTQLSLKLPPLPKGTYLVTYHVISADGHPVDGTYLFAVGEQLDELAGGTYPETEHLHYEKDPFRSSGILDVLLFAARILYYLLLLAFTGWLLWLRWTPRLAPATREKLRAAAVRLQQAYAIGFIVWMWSQLPSLIGGSGADGLVYFFTRTTTGYAWIAGLALALLSFAVLYRRGWLDLVWVSLVWFAKSWLGHAAAYGPRSETLLLDWLHLAGASIWAGGLLLLLYLWRQDKEEARRFYPAFSNAALLVILLLAASGIFIVFIFLPDVTYVLETTWGLLLLAKTGLVVLVALTALGIRLAFRKDRPRAIGAWMRADAVLMLLICGVVGVFTYLTPQPENKPLNWHVMGEHMHMTAQISPKVPGVNDFTVKVWLPEQLGKPKQVILRLQDTEAPDIAPIVVPLAPAEDRTTEESFGMERHTYKSRGAYLPYAGYWQIEVRVMDSNDDETVYKNIIRVY